MAIPEVPGSGTPNDGKYIEYTFKSGVNIRIDKELAPIFHDTQDGMHDVPRGDYFTFGDGKLIELDETTPSGASISIEHFSTAPNSEAVQGLTVKADKANFFLKTKNGQSELVDIFAKDSKISLDQDNSDTINFESEGKSALYK